MVACPILRGMGTSAFTNDVWATIIGPRYRDDKTITGGELAQALGIPEGTLVSQMRRRGFRRNVSATVVPPAATVDLGRPRWPTG